MVKIREKRLFKTLTIPLVFILLWFMVKLFIPTIPSLKNKFLLCNLYDTSSWYTKSEFLKYFKSVLSKSGKVSMEVTFDKSFGEVEFSCKSSIPLLKLYQANTLHFEIKSNQKVDVNVNLRIKGGGVPLEYKTYNKEEENYVNDLIYSLDQKNNPKINWLRGDFDEILFTVKNFDRSQDLIIEIFGIYLL